jgi:hypothetical protein
VRVVATDKEEALLIDEEFTSGFMVTEGDSEALGWLTTARKIKCGY